METDVAGALALQIKDAWKSIEERIDSPLHSAPVEASSDPLFGLVARLEAYSAIAGQAATRLQTSLSEIRTFAAGLRPRFDKKLADVPAEDVAETVRLFSEETSACVRRMWWSVEWELHIAIRAKYDFTMVPRLDQVPELDRIYGSFSHLLLPTFGTCIRNRLLILKGLGSMQAHLSKMEYEDQVWTQSGDEAARKRVVTYQEIIRCTLTPEFQRVAEATQEHAEGRQTWRADADAYLQITDHFIRLYIRENLAVAAAVWSLGLPRYQDLFERINYAGPVGLDRASNGACRAPRGLEGVGRGGSVTRAPAACRKEKQQQRPSGHAAGKGHGKTSQEPSPLSVPGKPSQELGPAQRQGDTTGRSRRTLWDFFSSSQRQSVSKPMPLPVSNRPSLAAAPGHVPVSSPALTGDGRP